MYLCVYKREFFLFPTVVIGFDRDNTLFFELVWLNLAIGVGEVP